LGYYPKPQRCASGTQEGMKRQKLEIGHPLAITVTWYDSGARAPKEVFYDGEVIGCRESQVIVPASKRMPSESAGRFCICFSVPGFFAANRFLKEVL